MRLACLTNTLLDPCLGSGKTVLSWSHGLRDLGHHVDVIDPSGFYHPFPRGWARRLKMRLDPLRLEAQLLEGGYDLVEFYGAEFGPLIRHLSRRNRPSRPFLVSHTNGLELLAGENGSRFFNSIERTSIKKAASAALRPWMHRFDRWAFSCADAFAAISQGDCDYIIEEGILPADRCVVVEPGIDNIFLQSDWRRPKAHQMVSLGSWTERKDPQTLIAVAVQVMQADPHVIFHVMGAGGEQRSILEDIPSELQSRVIVHPRLGQQEVVEVLTQSKVFLFPSLYEGFGMATTEAMACGCAVVVTPTGFGASIKNGEDGVVCAFKDVANMTRATLGLLKDDGHREKMAAAGRKRVSLLSWPSQVEKLWSAYDNWLQGSRETRSS